MWIDQQDKQKLATWVKFTKVPMLATMPDGKILWANEAFENLLGYTLTELERLTWIKITKDDDDLEYDLQNAASTIAGERFDYQLQKTYIAKSGSSKSCVIDVMRFPRTGEFQCFLVAVLPLDRGSDLALIQLSEIRTLMLTLMSQPVTGLTWEKATIFAKEHPLVASIIGTFLATVLFGERVIELLKLFGVLKTE